MRLKEDNSSYKAESIKRRNFRQSPVDNVVIKRKSKKNTKKWCKGKLGREHDWEITFPKNESILHKWRRLPVCKICKKQDWSKTEYRCKKCDKWHRSLFNGCAVKINE